MPPKKNAEEATPPPVADATENAPDPKLLEQKAMVERELAASHLAARLARYQMDAASLVDARATLMDDLESIRAKSGSANAKLSEQLRGKNATVASLRARLAEVHEECEAGREHGEARLAALAAESVERRHAMVADLAARDALVAQLNSFEDTRETMHGELAEKEHLLANARTEHEQTTRALETDTRLAKQQMKEDLARKIREAKREMKETTDRQLAGTTKRTIAENEQMLGELRYQQRESAAMEDRRIKFIAEANAAEDSLRISMNQEREVAMYNVGLLRELRGLEERLRGERAAAALERGDGKSKLKKNAKTEPSAFTRSNDADLMLETISRRIARAAAEREETEAEIELLEASVSAGKETNGLGTGREDVVAFLRTCARDLEESEGDAGSDPRWGQRRNMVNAALKGIRSGVSVEEMLAAMVQE
jgi:hypothetical protein|tara:strand:+ start:1522 stop:2802 length:1281 start_codon:yes stop_codon:yes gene_type:complete